MATLAPTAILVKKELPIQTYYINKQVLLLDTAEMELPEGKWKLPELTKRPLIKISSPLNIYEHYFVERDVSNLLKQKGNNHFQYVSSWRRTPALRSWRWRCAGDRQSCSGHPMVCRAPVNQAVARIHFGWDRFFIRWSAIIIPLVATWGYSGGAIGFVVLTKRVQH